MLKNPRSFFYVLIVAASMIGAYFITEFILEQLSITAFTPFWIVIQGVTICLVALVLQRLLPKLSKAFYGLSMIFPCESAIVPQRN